MTIIKNEIINHVTRSFEIDEHDVAQVFFWQGFYHGQDRFIQMELLRTITHGKVCEYLEDNEENLKIDCFMRELGLVYFAKIEAENLSHENRKNLQSYCDGVNDAITKNRSLFLKILGIPFSPWTITDCIVTLKIMSYLGLAQGQQDLEKLLIELLQKGIDYKKIESLINNKDKFDKNILNIIKKVNLAHKNLDASIISKLPKIQASNNWVVRTNDGIIHACDPHLECNRLPSIWYEMKIKTPQTTMFGISMPGVPGIVMGKKDKISYSFTYGFMDMIDYFVEEINDSESNRIEENFTKLQKRLEVIKRKKSHPFELLIYHTNNGLIEREHSQRDQKIRSGHYLAMNWTCMKNGANETFGAITSMMQAQSLTNFKDALKNVCISCNWLISDEQDFAYQQSGLAPNRQKGMGLFPNLGYNLKDTWDGFLDATKLESNSDNNANYLITANNDISHSNGPQVINAPMASYRRDSIESFLINDNDNNMPDKHKKMQHSTYSIQAEKFFKKYENEFSASKIKNFDFNYTITSKEALGFEEFYENLLSEFIKDQFDLSESESSYLYNKTCLIADFYGLYDRLFLEELSTDEYTLWFSKKSPQEYIQRAVQNIKAERSWGEKNKIDMNFILFDGKLPAFVTKDLRNIPIKGNRATIHQGSVYISKNRRSSFLPSWRMISRSDSNEVFSVIPGGLDDKIFGRNYKSDINHWLNELYRSTIL